MTHDATRTVDTPDGPMALYEVAPDATTSSAVIVIQEAFGVNDYIRDVTRRFAAAGYHAVAPTMFHRADRLLLREGIVQVHRSIGRLNSMGRVPRHGPTIAGSGEYEPVAARHAPRPPLVGPQ